jgi:hypothetical protein
MQVARSAGHVELADFIHSRAFALCPLLAMPYDVVAHVMSFLDPFDLCAIAQTCRVWSRPMHTAFSAQD